jgi:hypothetical protein
MSPPTGSIPEIIAILSEAHRDAERADALAAAILDAQADALGSWDPDPPPPAPPSPQAQQRVIDCLAERAKFSRERLERRILRQQRWNSLRAEARRAAYAAGWGEVLEEARTQLDRLEHWAGRDLGGADGPDAGWDALTACWWDLRERLGDVAGAGEAGGGPPQQPPVDLMAVKDLARAGRVPVGALGIALRRFWPTHRDCRQAVQGRRRNEPNVLYRVQEVWDAVVLPLWERHSARRLSYGKKSPKKSR